jgi:hypothetical protein
MRKDRNSFPPTNQNSNFFLNPQMQNPQMMNPQMMNPQMMNPQMINPQMMNPQMMPGIPNQMPMQNMYNPNMVPEQMYQYGGYTNPENYEMRITKIEKMLKKLDSRILKIENNDGTVVEDDDITTSSNMYMI